MKQYRIEILIIFVFFSSRRRHTRCALVTGVQTCALPICHPPPRDHAKRASSDARLTPPEALDMMLSMLSFMRFGSRFTRRQKRLRGLQYGLDLRLFISIIAPRKFGAQLLDLLLDGHLNLLDHAKDYVRDRGGAGRVKDRKAAAQRRRGCRFF